MPTRYFNTLEVKDGTLYKSSADNPTKIEHEYEWMKEISSIDSLKKYVPDNVSFKDGVLSMKYYEEGDLGKKLLKKTSKKEMRSAIDRLLDVFLDFRHTDVDTSVKCEGFYSKRLSNRLIDNPFYKKFNYYLINGKVFDDVQMPLVFDKCKELNLSEDVGLMHGDLFFSNVLLDGDEFKLIDPRGSFDEEFSLYGDRRYDLAKLRHSISGGYDCIINDKYSLSYKNNIVDYKINFGYDVNDATDYFDNRVRCLGYNVSDIKFIEGLLFLTMIPLHKESIEHQLLFYITAIQKLSVLYDYR